MVKNNIKWSCKNNLLTGLMAIVFIFSTPLLLFVLMCGSQSDIDQQAIPLFQSITFGLCILLLHCGLVLMLFSCIGVGLPNPPEGLRNLLKQFLFTYLISVVLFTIIWSSNAGVTTAQYYKWDMLLCLMAVGVFNEICLFSNRAICFLLETFPTAPKQNGLPVYYGKERSIITLETIVLINHSNRINWVVCQDGSVYISELKLNEVFCLLGPKSFYKVNRRQIVSRNMIRLYELMSFGRIKLILYKEYNIEIIVSKGRVAGFKKWMYYSL